MHQDLIQAYRKAPWRVQLQIIGLFSLVLVMAALIAGIYLNVTARAATIGRNIQDMQEEILKLQRDNADLQTKLASLTSVSAMEKRATDLGFRLLEPGEILYLQVPGYQGLQEAVLAPPPGPALSPDQELPPAFTETLTDWMKDFILNPQDIQDFGLFPGQGDTSTGETSPGGKP